MNFWHCYRVYLIMISEFCVCVKFTFDADTLKPKLLLVFQSSATRARGERKLIKIEIQLVVDDRSMTTNNFDWILNTVYLQCARLPSRQFFCSGEDTFNSIQLLLAVATDRNHHHFYKLISRPWKYLLAKISYYLLHITANQNCL